MHHNHSLFEYIARVQVVPVTYLDRNLKFTDRLAPGKRFFEIDLIYSRSISHYRRLERRTPLASLLAREKECFFSDAEILPGSSTLNHCRHSPVL
jgi:hypothetical protein